MKSVLLWSLAGTFLLTGAIVFLLGEPAAGEGSAAAGTVAASVTEDGKQAAETVRLITARWIDKLRVSNRLGPLQPDPELEEESGNAFGPAV